jgi:hypothetical protein
VVADLPGETRHPRPRAELENLDPEFIGVHVNHVVIATEEQVLAPGICALPVRSEGVQI